MSGTCAATPAMLFAGVLADAPRGRAGRLDIRSTGMNEYPWSVAGRETAA